MFEPVLIGDPIPEYDVTVIKTGDTVSLTVELASGTVSGEFTVGAIWEGRRGRLCNLMRGGRVVVSSVSVERVGDGATPVPSRRDTGHRMALACPGCQR